MCSRGRRPTIRLAAAQTVPVRGDVAANTEEHARLARIAGREGARVVVFPELSLTGYELGLAPELAFAPDDGRLAALSEAAAESGATLVVGAPVRVGEALHIGAFALAPDGGVELYTKRHLGAFSPDANPGGAVPPDERSVFSPGELDPLVPVGGVDAAVAICADTGRASHPRRAAERGAAVYLASTFVVPLDEEQIDARLRGHAREHGLVVVQANYGGPTGGLAACGRSAIWSALGERVVRLGSAGAGLALAEPDGEAWSGRAIEPA